MCVCVCVCVCVCARVRVVCERVISLPTVVTDILVLLIYCNQSSGKGVVVSSTVIHSSV